MKRVFLQNPGQSSTDPTLLRAASLALASFATNGDAGRNSGDPVYDWVTEHRRKDNEDRRAHGSPEVNYSSCADLGHWLLMCLGCRDERIINRDFDGGFVPWKIGVNVARLVMSPWYVKAIPGRRPIPGDITHVCAAPNTDHIAVLERLDLQAKRQFSFDYGQPYGRHKELQISVGPGGPIWIGGRMLRGWIDIEQVNFVESAIVPNDFVGGIPDDNPYEESLVIPANVP